MFLSHSFLLHRWLQPVWEDNSFWAVGWQVLAQKTSAPEATYQEATYQEATYPEATYQENQVLKNRVPKNWDLRNWDRENLVRGNMPGEDLSAGNRDITFAGMSCSATTTVVTSSMDSKNESRINENHTNEHSTDAECLHETPQDAGRGGFHCGTVIIGSFQRFSLTSLGGQPVVAQWRYVGDMAVHQEDVGPQADSSQALSYPMGILALALCQHDAPLGLLEEWTSRVRCLYLVDWAMPERNLDYLGHVLPLTLALLSGREAYRRFRGGMAYGPEGLAEQFNASQDKVFLRRLHHKKYRWGSIIAVGYAVERQ